MQPLFLTHSVGGNQVITAIFRQKHQIVDRQSKMSGGHTNQIQECCKDPLKKQQNYNDFSVTDTKIFVPDTKIPCKFSSFSVIKDEICSCLYTFNHQIFDDNPFATFFPVIIGHNQQSFVGTFFGTIFVHFPSARARRKRPIGHLSSRRNK